MGIYRRRSSQLTTSQHVQIIRSQSLRRQRSLKEKTISSVIPRLPLELIDRIVELSLQDDCPALGPLALVSRTLRILLLRHYFRTVKLQTHHQWASHFKFLVWNINVGAFNWIRTLTTPVGILTTHIERLSHFSNLQCLSINFESEGLATQHLCIKRICQNLNRTSGSLASLRFTRLPRIDVSLLSLLAASFPRITDLYLNCTDVLNFDHCWYCLQESTERTVHSPIPTRFSGAEEMATAFGNALKPMTDLINLHLGVFISSESLIDRHIEHTQQNEDEVELATVPDADCDICEPAEKGVRKDELQASLIMAQKLKSLQSVGWSSFFSYAGRDLDVRGEMAEGDGDGEESGEVAGSPDGGGDGGEDQEASIRERRTKIWVLRVNGRVRVRRVPWF